MYKLTLQTYLKIANATILLIEQKKAKKLQSLNIFKK